MPSELDCHCTVGAGEPVAVVINVTGLPWQPLVSEGRLLVMTGVVPTATVTVVVFIQPNVLVPVTVYVVALEGLADTLAPVVAERPVAGLQL
jgi:hypothetical protein